MRKLAADLIEAYEEHCSKYRLFSTPRDFLAFAESRGFVMTLGSDAVHANSLNHGWWETEEDKSIPVKLALVHSEISEALEGYRNHIPEGAKGCLSEEMADTVIRIRDLSGRLGIDLDEAILKKHEYNVGRPYRHGGKEI